MYVIAGQFKVKPEFRDELMTMSEALVKPSCEEDGCISYDFYEDKLKENNFLFFERWQDRDSINEHFNKSYFKDFSDRFPSMIEGKAEINIYEINQIETL